MNVFMTPELLEDNIFWAKVLDAFIDEYRRSWETDFMIWEYDLIHGKGAYERFIFGGAPGL